MSRLWFMPATPVLSNGGTTRGLPISCFLNTVPDFARRHRRDLERECVARLQWRRHRHLLGQGALDRRGREGLWRDVRHHPLHSRDGRPDPGDQPGLAAARLGGLLSRHPPSGDRGVPRNPQGLGRLQPQGSQSPSRHQHHRRVHGGGARRHDVRPAQPEDPCGDPRGRCAATCGSASSRRGCIPASPICSSSTP